MSREDYAALLDLLGKFLEVPAAECDAVARAVREEMEGVIPLAVPLRVDLAWGRNWAEAH